MKSKPSQLGDLASHLGLETHVHRARQKLGRRSAPTDRSIEERPDRRAQADEHRSESRPREARLPLVEEHVVAVPAAGQAIGLGLLEGHHAAEPRQERARVAILARGPPGLVGQRGDAGQILDQRGGQEPGLLVLFAQLAKIDRRGVARRQSGPELQLGFGEEIAEPRVRGLHVQEAGHQGLLLGAVLGATLGHVDIRVPLEEGRARGEQRLLAGAVEQLEIGRVGTHPVSYGTKAGPDATLRSMLTPIEETGLAGARLAARVQRAMLQLPEAELGALLKEIDRRARAERLIYLRDEVEETIRVLATPIAALPDQLAYVRAVTLALHGALKRLPELYLTDPDVQALLALPPREEEWLRRYWTPAVSEQNTVVGRHDAAIDFGSPHWKESLQFLEPNLGGIGGLHLIPTASHILAEVVLPALRARDPQLELESAQDIRALLMQDLLDHLEATGRKGRTVCFVEPKYAGYGPDEQGELARYIHAHFGIEVCHADPAELALDGDEVTYQGRVIDLVYRDYAVEDLLELQGEGVDVRPMQQAFATNRVVSSIAAELDQKSCWEVLGDPVLARRHFSSEDRAFFRRHLPWTRLLRPGTIDAPRRLPGGPRRVRRARPGGPGPQAQPRATAAPASRSAGSPTRRSGSGWWTPPWPRAAERWVAQRAVSLPVCQFPVMDADGRIHAEPFYVVFGFAPSAYGLATLGRASQSRVVNVALHGGMCVLVVGHPPGQIVL